MGRIAKRGLLDQQEIVEEVFSPHRVKKYDQNVDYTFFESMDVTVDEGKDPWIFFLTHPDLLGRFVWYPTTGSLIFEPPRKEAYKVGEWTNSEEVYDVIMNTINAQQNG